MKKQLALFAFAALLGGCAPQHKVVFGEGGKIIREYNKPKKRTDVVIDILSTGDTLVTDFDAGKIYIKTKQ